MAIYRQFRISFWQDEFISELTTEERYFYAYLLTNTKTTQCGIYRLNKNLSVVETGFDRETIDKLLKKFVSYKKIYVSEETNEIMVINWMKYNFINSKNTITCINKELKEVKDKAFLEKFYEICEAFQYPVQTLFQGITLDFLEREQLQGKQCVQKETCEICEENFERFEEAYKGRGEEEIQIKEEAVEEKEEYIGAKEPAEEAATFEKVVEFFCSNIHRITHFECTKLWEWRKAVRPELILMAIKEAIEHNAKSIHYINAVLSNWFDRGLKTEGEVCAYAEERKRWQKKEKQSFDYPPRINREAYRVVGGEF